MQKGLNSSSSLLEGFRPAIPQSTLRLPMEHDKTLPWKRHPRKRQRACPDHAEKYDAPCAAGSLAIPQDARQYWHRGRSPRHVTLPAFTDRALSAPKHDALAGQIRPRHGQSVDLVLPTVAVFASCTAGLALCWRGRAESFPPSHGDTSEWPLLCDCDSWFNG